MVIMPTFSKVEGVWGAARCGEPESVVNCAPEARKARCLCFSQPRRASRALRGAERGGKLGVLAHVGPSEPSEQRQIAGTRARLVFCRRPCLGADL